MKQTKLLFTKQRNGPFHGRHFNKKLPVNTDAINKIYLGQVPFMWQSLSRQPSETRADCSFFLIRMKPNLDYYHWKQLCWFVSSAWLQFEDLIISFGDMSDQE